jgi:hypothetical protein
MADTGPSKTAHKREERFIGDVPGCFVLLDPSGHQPASAVLPFVARSISTSKAVVSAAIEVEIQKGQTVALRFDTVGVRHGVVERVLPEGFIVTFSGDGVAEGDLDARIDWLKRKSRGQAAEHRIAKRVLPRNPDVVVVLGAEKFLEARIKDMSETGVALQATVQPQLGHLLAVGSVAGHVARHFPGGFAVHFLERQNLTEIEGLMTLQGRRDKHLAAARLGSAA